MRAAAEASGTSKRHGGPLFLLFGVQPHRAEHFKLFPRPFFVEKVRDVVGLYRSPPDNARVLCVDEKSRVQALERIHPVLPMGLDYLEGARTIIIALAPGRPLFAAIDVLDGKVISQCKPRHRHQEFLAYLNHLDRQCSTGLDVHLIADNYGTHKYAKVKAWPARHPCYHLHYTPTYASSLNQVERWFGLITRQATRRGWFRNVKEFVQKIDAHAAHYNCIVARLFGPATADSILARLQHHCKVLSGHHTRVHSEFVSNICPATFMHLNAIVKYGLARWKPTPA